MGSLVTLGCMQVLHGGADPHHMLWPHPEQGHSRCPCPLAGICPPGAGRVSDGCVPSQRPSCHCSSCTRVMGRQQLVQGCLFQLHQPEQSRQCPAAGRCCHPGQRRSWQSPTLLSPGVPLHRHLQLPPPLELPPPKTPAFCKALSIPSRKSGILIKSVSRP